MGTLQCPLCCGESFPDKCSLKYHLLSNTTISCPACLQGFPTVIDLANHLDAHCGNEGSAGTLAVSGPHLKASPAQATNHSDVAAPDEQRTLLASGNHSSKVSIVTDELMDYEVVDSRAVAASEKMEVIQEWEQEDNELNDFSYVCVTCNCTIENVVEHVTRYHSDELEFNLQTVEVVTGIPNTKLVSDVGTDCCETEVVESILPRNPLTPNLVAQLESDDTTNKNSPPILQSDYPSKRLDTNIVEAVDIIPPLKPLASKLLPELSGLRLPSIDAKNKNLNPHVLLENNVLQILSTYSLKPSPSVLPSKSLGSELSHLNEEVEHRSLHIDVKKKKKTTDSPILLNPISMKSVTSVAKTIENNLTSKPTASTLLSKHRNIRNDDTKIVNTNSRIIGNNVRKRSPTSVVKAVNSDLLCGPLASERVSKQRDVASSDAKKKNANSPILLNNTVAKRSPTSVVKAVDSDLLCGPLASELVSKQRDVASSDAKRKNANSPILLNNTVAKRSITSVVKAVDSDLLCGPLASELVSKQRDVASSDDKKKNANSPILLNNTVAKRSTIILNNCVAKRSTKSIVKPGESNLPIEQSDVESPQHHSLQAERKSVSSGDDDDDDDNPVSTNIVKAVENLLRYESLPAKLKVNVKGGRVPMVCGGSVLSNSDTTLVDVGSKVSTKSIDETVEGTMLCETPELLVDLEYNSPSNNDNNDLDNPCSPASADNLVIVEPITPSDKDLIHDSPAIPHVDLRGSKKNVPKRRPNRTRPTIAQMLKKLDVVKKSNMVDKRGLHYVRNIVKINKFWEPKFLDTSVAQPVGVGPVPDTEDGRPKQVVNSSSVTKPRKSTRSKKKPIENNVKPKVRERIQSSLTPSLITALAALSKTGSLISISESTGAPVASRKLTPSIFKIFGGVNDNGEHANTQQTTQGSEHGNTLLSVCPLEVKKKYLRNKCVGLLLGGRAKYKTRKPTMMTLKQKVRGRKALFKDMQNSSEPRAKGTSRIILCSNCRAEFRNYSRFSDHLCHETNDTITFAFVCDVCGTECMDPSDLHIHRMTHKQDLQKLEYAKRRERHCEICNMVSYSPTMFRYHYNAHVHDQIAGKPTDPLVGILKCNKCPLVFKTNESLKKHWQCHKEPSRAETVTTSVEIECPKVVVESIDEADDKDYFTCTMCGKRLPLGGRELHEKMHQGIEMIQCNICNKPFQGESDLQMHMIVHKQTEDTLVCFYCRLQFDNVHLLRGHVMGAHSVLDRPYSCSFCGRRFYKLMEKQKHEKIHTGERNHRCEVCGARFRHAFCATLHARIHSGVRPYKCTHCGKSFRTLSALHHHLTVHNTYSPYKCPYCSKDFKGLVYLRNHINQHTKLFTCNRCGRRFAVLPNLRSHMESHANGILKHICYLCGASYGRAYALKDHMKSHDRNNLPESLLEDNEKHAKKRKKRKRTKMNPDADSYSSTVNQC